MWPFRKSPGPRPVPSPASPGKGSDDLIPPDELRRSLAEQGYMIQGPFPIREGEESGNLICKNCGLPYDDFPWERAMTALVEALREADPGCKVVVVSCRKCSRTSAFSPKDIVTLQPDDSFGPWTINDVFQALPFYKRVDATLPPGIPDFEKRIAQVLNMNPAPL